MFCFTRAIIEKVLNKIDCQIRPLKGVDLWITTHEEEIKNYPFPIDKHTEIILGHQLDYDIYLEKKMINNQYKNASEKLMREIGTLANQLLSYMSEMGSEDVHIEYMDAVIKIKKRGL